LVLTQLHSGTYLNCSMKISVFTRGGQPWSIWDVFEIGLLERASPYLAGKILTVLKICTENVIVMFRHNFYAKHNASSAVFQKPTICFTFFSKIEQKNFIIQFSHFSLQLGQFSLQSTKRQIDWWQNYENPTKIDWDMADFLKTFSY